MHDKEKTKDELIRALRQRIDDLEAFEIERKAIAAELKATRQRLQYLLAASPAIIYATKASGDYACTFVTDNLIAIMGYTPQEMTTDPKAWPDNLHPDDASRIFDEMLPLIEREGGTIEYRFRHRDGHYIWIQDTFKVIYDDQGCPLELVGAWADITKLKQAEQVATEAEHYLARLIESSPDAIISTDKEGNVVLFNQGAETLLGYRVQEAVGRPVSVLYGGKVRFDDVVREMHKRGGTASGFKSTLQAKDGHNIPVLISASSLFDEGGKEAGMVVYATDLREREQEQEALQKARDEFERRVEERTAELKAARERLQYLMTVTPGIIYTTQASGDYACTFVSDNVDETMGFTPWEMLEDPNFWSARLHPEDRERVFSEMFPLIKSGGGAIEYRFRHRSGNYIWILDTFKVVYDDQGRPLEIVGSWADISDRKQAEQALGERMAIMKDLQTLAAASPAIIYTTQVSGEFACTFVSDNLNSVMGYAPWEMCDDPKFWVRHIHPDDTSMVLTEIERLISQGGGTLEYRFRHRRGHYVWIQDTFTVTHDDEGKPKELVGSWADVSEHKSTEAELKKLAQQVELRNQFIRKTFGRYLTDEVVTTLLESPSGLQLGGEKRQITMMMADLRGFTSISERLAPELVLTMLNRYLTAMVDVIKDYEGTIDEFIGDAIFVLFGAPTWREDDAERAVACAVAMQLAMVAVNERNRREGLPEVEMGIGVHTGQVVVGNIGSPERTKYGVVGSHVILTSRIQSYTTGGQILISDATRNEVGPILRVGQQVETRLKGVTHPVSLFEILGIDGQHKLFLSQLNEALAPLVEAIPCRCAIADAPDLGERLFKGRLTKLSAKAAEIHFEDPIPKLSNVEIHLTGADGQEIPAVLYGKIVEKVGYSQTECHVRFTSIPPEIEKLFDILLASTETKSQSEKSAEPEKKQRPPRRRNLRVV